MIAHNPEMLSEKSSQDAVEWQSNEETSVKQTGLSKLPVILRGFGAMVVLASISIFLFQGWNSSNDTGRYLLLLGHTGALAIIGFLSGHFMRESKGARLLLTISLASIPANFAILGGFLYSQFSMDGINVIYPGIVSWSAGSPSSALMVSAISVVLLLPVTILGFMVLSRRSAKPLSILYLLSNLALLIPIRHAAFVGWTALAISVFVMYMLNKASKNNPSIRTLDGRIARVLQFIPVAVLLGRSMWLYSASAFIITVLSMMVFLLMRHISLLMASENTARRTLEIFSLAPALTVGMGVADMVYNSLPAFNGIFLIVFALVTAALILELSFRSAGDGAGYRRIAAAILTISMLFNLWMFGGVLLAAACLGVGLAVAIYGYMNQQSVVLGMGVLTLLAGLGYQVMHMVYYFNLGGWTSLAVLGVVSILCGSLIERHGDRIKSGVQKWSSNLRAWQY